MPISVQAAPTPATPDKAAPAASAKSAKKETSFTGLLDLAQAAPVTGKPEAHFDGAVPASKQIHRKPAQVSDSQRDSMGEGPDQRPTIDLASTVPVPEVNPLIVASPVPTANVPLVDEPEPSPKSPASVRVGVGLPSLAIAGNGIETAAAPKKQPSSEPVDPAVALAEFAPCTRAGDAAVVESGPGIESPATSVENPEIALPGPPVFPDKLPTPPAASLRRSPGKPVGETRGEPVHELDNNGEPLAAQLQAPPGTTPHPATISGSSATDGMVPEKLKVPAAQPALSVPGAGSTGSPSVQPDNISSVARGPSPVQAMRQQVEGTHGPQDGNIKKVRAENLPVFITLTRPETSGQHAVSAESTSPVPTRLGSAPKHAIEPTGQESSANPEFDGGRSAAAPSTPAMQSLNHQAVATPAQPLTSQAVTSPVPHVSPDMHTAAGSPLQPGTDSALPTTEPTPQQAATGQVHVAQLTTRTEHSEMRIALQTPAFGNVEVHAVVRESQVGLAIGSERGDLHRILAVEVPGLAGRLQQHDLHLDGVRFFEQGPSFSAGSEGAGSRSRSFGQPRTFTQGSSHSRELSPFPEQEAPLETGAGLNVRA